MMFKKIKDGLFVTNKEREREGLLRERIITDLYRWELLRDKIVEWEFFKFQN